jgi:hypothetical protein
MRIIIVLLALTVAQAKCNGQVLISLLLGDKLNTGKIEFGLDGGFTISDIKGLDKSDDLRTFNLGFYFDIKLKNPAWMIHTGVIVKSNMGAEDLPVYLLNNPNLDAAFQNGHVVRKLGYFNVPVMIKYKWKNNFYAEAGPTFGLMSKSTDEFMATVNSKNDLTYKIKIRDRYHPLDFGVTGGIGYRLMGGHGMNLGVRYYYGMVDITIDDSTAGQYNQAIYIAVGIPIGVGKSQANKPKE